MRKVILAMFMSLDGYIAGPGGEFVGPDWSDDLQRYWSDANIDPAGMLLYGRVGFEFNAGFWQAAETDPTSPPNHRAFAARMNALPKLVFSRTLQSADWNARVISDNIADEITRLKQEPGKDLVLLSGASIASTFLELGLIDRFHLLITPILLGGGIRLFEGGYAREKLNLVDSKVADTGAIILTYDAPA